MAKAAKTRPVTRKAQAKRANAPMKNTPKEKSPGTKARAEAKKAARTMAKIAAPGIRKSAAKRVEKTAKKAALSAAAVKRIDDIKTRAGGLILCIKRDVLAAARGEMDSVQVKKMLRTMTNLEAETRRECAAMQGGD